MQPKQRSGRERRENAWISRLAVPVQPPHGPIEEVGPNHEEQAFSSQESSLEVVYVLPASPDGFLGLVFSPSCSPVPAEWPPLDSEVLGPYVQEPTSPSLVLDEPSPTCSPDDFWGFPDISMVPPDNSYCLPEDSSTPLEKPCPDVEKGFIDLSSLALTLSEFYIIGEAHSEVYHTYGLKGSNEEIAFYKEYIEPIPSLVESTPSLAEGLPSLVLGTSSPSSTLEPPMDKGE